MHRIPGVTQSVCLIALSAAWLSAQPKECSGETRTPPVTVSVSLSASYLQGEPISATIVYTNNANADYAVALPLRQHFLTGIEYHRADGWRQIDSDVAIDTPPPPPVFITKGNRIQGESVDILKPGQILTRKCEFPHLAHVLRPGNYRVDLGRCAAKIFDRSDVQESDNGEFFVQLTTKSTGVVFLDKQQWREFSVLPPTRTANAPSLPLTPQRLPELEALLKKGTDVGQFLRTHEKETVVAGLAAALDNEDGDIRYHALGCLLDVFQAWDNRLLPFVIATGERNSYLSGSIHENHDDDEFLRLISIAATYGDASAVPMLFKAAGVPRLARLGEPVYSTDGPALPMRKGLDILPEVADALLKCTDGKIGNIEGRNWRTPQERDAILVEWQKAWSDSKVQNTQ